MKSATKNFFILMLIVAIAAIVGYGYTTSYVSGLISKTSEAKDEIDNLEIQYNHLKALHKAAENTSDESSKIASYIVRSGGSVDFITNIEQVAAAGGLVYNTDKIEAISTPELDFGQKELLEVSFSVTGNWTSLIRFLKLVENMPYGIKIQRFELTSLGDAKADIAKINSVSVGANGTSTASTTPVKKVNSSKENKWKAVVMFDVVKIKDN
jgi:hypothetical protein